MQSIKYQLILSILFGSQSKFTPFLMINCKSYKISSVFSFNQICSSGVSIDDNASYTFE
jgi:hypothetical protein